MERIKDALEHGQYFLTHECAYNLWVLAFLNTGAELPACLSEENTSFGKKMWFLFEWEFLVWHGMSLAQQAQKKQQQKNNDY